MRANPGRLSRAEVATYYAARAPEVKQVDSSEWRGPCPIHLGDRDSFAVRRETGEWFCHSECARGGTIIGLEMALAELDFKDAARKVRAIIRGAWRVVAAYVYRDESGKPLFRVIRRELGQGQDREKTFGLQRYEKGCWLNGLQETRRVPYRLHKILTAKCVFITEGEKDADTLRTNLKVTATTNPMGAGKWLPDYARYFKGKRVIILPDNDDAGKATPRMLRRHCWV